MKKLFVLFATICMLFVFKPSNSLEKSKCDKLQLKCGDHVIEEFTAEEMLEIMKYRQCIQAENEGRAILKMFPEEQDKIYVLWLNKDKSVIRGMVFHVTMTQKTEPL